MGVKTIQDKLHSMCHALELSVATRMNNRPDNGATWFVKVNFDEAKVFARIHISKALVRNGETPTEKQFTSQSVVCFVALADGQTKTQGIWNAGDIFKGTYKAPVARGKRGNIENWTACVDREDGHIKYLR